MSTPRLNLSQLRKILRNFDVSEDPSAGKGSHTVFIKVIEGKRMTYPVPTTGQDVLPCYVKGCRKKFKLLPRDGVSDDEFYGRR